MQRPEAPNTTWCPPGGLLAPGVWVDRLWPGVVIAGTERDSSGKRTLWAARGLRVWAVGEDAARPEANSGFRIAPFGPGLGVRDAFEWSCDLLQTTLGRANPGGLHAWLSLALRTGVQQVLSMPSGTTLVVTRGALWRLGEMGQLADVWRFHGVSKPARAGLCLDTAGRVWLAGYSRNPARHAAVALFVSEDEGRTFREARRWAAGVLRHLHFVQQDPYGGDLWVGSGDTDSETRLWRIDPSLSWHEVGGGDQRWRATRLVFLPDAVVWGTDGGRDVKHASNHAVRWDRRTGELRIEQALQGPVHGAARMGEGVVLATGWEGGAGGPDRRIHLWRRDGGGTYCEVLDWPAGPQHPRIQYALAHLSESGHADAVWATVRGARGWPLGAVRVRVGRTG